MAEIFGVCYCENPECDRMFDMHTLKDAPQNESGTWILPCGHKFERGTWISSSLRDDNHRSYDYEFLMKQYAIPYDALEELAEHKAENGFDW